MCISVFVCVCGKFNRPCIYLSEIMGGFIAHKIHVLKFILDLTVCGIISCAACIQFAH